jgi:hypothetical protein
MYCKQTQAGLVSLTVSTNLNELSYIEGRRISDNIIAAHETTHSLQLSSSKDKASTLEIDLAKAFDSLERSFIVTALARKGLHGHSIRLIHSCMYFHAFLFCCHQWVGHTQALSVPAESDKGVPCPRTFLCCMYQALTELPSNQYSPFLQMVFLSAEKHQQWKLGTLNKPCKTFVPAQVGFQIGQNLE